MPPKKPERARVDLSMGSSFRRSAKELATRNAAKESEEPRETLGSRAVELVRAIESSYVVNDNDAFMETVSDALAILGVRLRDLGLERNGFLSRIERGVEQSDVIPTGLKEGFVAKLRDAVEALVIEGREGASRRARQRHAKALTPMLSAVAAESDLRRRVVLSKERAEKLIASSVRTAPDGSREGHADLAPFVAGVIADDEMRYYLSLAIDDDVERRSEEAIEDIEAKREAGEDVFVPVVCIGTGVYGQVVANELMSELPDVMERDVMFLDAADHLGGQFAVGTRAVFKVNNRVRPEDPDSLARPGTPDNIMPLGDHAVIDLPAVSAQTYPSQNLLGGCLKTNLYLNTHQNMTGARVVGLIKNPEGSNARYTVEFVRENKLYRITTNILTIADGIGESKVGFTDPFDIPTRELIAESRKATERGEVPQYYSFQDFARLASREESENWREKLSGEGVIIGDGDSGIVTAAALLGYGPDDVGSTQLDFTKQISWVGQKAENAEAWCNSARPRYVDLAREFPRETIEIDGKKKERRVTKPQVFLTQRRQDFEPVRVAFEAFLDNETPENRNAYTTAIRTARQNDAQFPLGLPQPSSTLLALNEAYSRAFTEVERGELLAEGVVDREKLAISELISKLETLAGKIQEPIPSAAFVALLRPLASIPGGGTPYIRPQPSGAPEYSEPLTIVGNLLFPNGFLDGNGINIFDFSGSRVALRRTPEFNGSTTQLLPEIDRKAFLRSLSSAVTLLKREEQIREKRLAAAKAEIVEITEAAVKTDGKQQEGYSRIVPVKEKAVRAERFVDVATGKSRVRVFCEDGRIVEADWIIDASGVTSRTNELFRDFSAPEQRERAIPNIERPFDVLFKTPGLQFDITEGFRNPFLRNISVRCLRTVQSTDDQRAFAVVRVKTSKNQEFQFDCLRTREGDVSVITSTNDYDAAQIARALEDWSRSQSDLNVGNPKVVGGVVPDIFANTPGTNGLRVRPVAIEDPDTLIPVASRLTVNGEEEGVYFLGPTNKFPLSEEERKQIPALSKVTANLASMFRYVNPTAKFVGEVLAPEIERQSSRESAPSIITADRQERALWRKEEDTNIREARIAFDDVSIPSIANPRVIVRYLVRRITMENRATLTDAQLEQDAEKLPRTITIRVERLSKKREYLVSSVDAQGESIKLWNALSADSRFIPSLILATRPRGSGGSYQVDTRTGEILAVAA